PTGNTRVWLSDPPAGYLVSSARDAIEDLEVLPDQPVIHRDYRVRRGTVWDFQFLRGSDGRPFPGFVTTTSTQMAPAVPSHAQADDHGRAHLTLPTERGRVELGVREWSPLASSEIDTGTLRLRLQWDPGFRPDQLAEVSRPEGNERRFRLMDADGN